MDFSNATMGYVESGVRSIYTFIIVSLIILLIGFVIGKLLGKVTARILHELELDNIIRRATGRDAKLEHRLSSAVTFLIYFITLMIVLDSLNVTTTVLKIIFAAVVVVIIVSLVLAVKDFIPNAFAGLYLYRHRIIKEGERVKIGRIKGRVIHINLIETKIQTMEGDTVYIPNSALSRTEITKIRSSRKNVSRKKQN